MPRPPGFYKRQGYFCTSAGGVQHHKLCRIEEGVKTAREQLYKLLSRYADLPKSTKKNLVPTVGEAHDSFLDDKKAQKSFGTYEFYRTSLQTFHEMFANRKIKELTHNDGVAYKMKLQELGYANNTMNARIQAPKTLLNWVCSPSRQQDYQCYQNPFSELSRLTQTNRERNITDQEYDVILKQMAKLGERHVLGGAQDSNEMFGVMRGTTMRPQELRRLRWEYIKWDKHQIVFPAPFVKTRSRRAITMLDSVETILRNRAERLKSHGNDVTKGLVFFVTKKSPKSGKRRDANTSTDIMISASNLSCKWRRAVLGCVKLGLIDDKTDVGMLVPYSFRHTRITELVLEEHPFPIIMGEAGHKNPRTTLRYVHMATDETVERLRKADKEKTDVTQTSSKPASADGGEK